MSRLTGFSSPLLLGFDEMERLLDRVSKAAADGYPPYNIERICGEGGEPERLRITLAVAGFNQDDLDITVEENELTITGQQTDDVQTGTMGDRGKDYLYRGIAARQFKRTFVLADGMNVSGAGLRDGLLSIDLVRPESDKVVRKIAITSNS
jgi:HSP20 family molecular chaperone IbpA